MLDLKVFIIRQFTGMAHWPSEFFIFNALSGDFATVSMSRDELTFKEP
jgi:hypothetical protein